MKRSIGTILTPYGTNFQVIFLIYIEVDADIDTPNVRGINRRIAANLSVFTLNGFLPPQRQW